MLILKCFGYFRLKEQQSQGNELKPCFDISGTFYWCEPTRFEGRLLVCCFCNNLFFSTTVIKLVDCSVGRILVPRHQVTISTSESLGEWVQALSAVISGIVCVDKR